MNALLLAALALSSPARAEVTLGQLCRAALDRAEEVREADARSRAASRRATGAMTELLPKLKAEAGSTAWTESQAVAIPFPLVVRPNNQQVLALSVEQPVFAGGALWKHYRSGAGAAEAASSESRAARESVLGETADLSYRLLEAGEALREAQSSLDRRAAHRDASKRKLSAGLATTVELSRAEAEAQAALAAKIEAEREAFAARERLKALTGVEISSGGPAVPERLEVPAAGPDESAGNPEVAAAERRSASLDDALSSAKGSLAPELVVGGQVRRSYESPETAFYLRDETFGFAKLQWDLFSGGRKLAELGEARAVRDASVQSYRRVKRDRAADAAIARESLLQADALVEAERARLEAARSAYSTAEQRYRNGLDSWLVRLDAETALTEAESSFTRARYARERAVLGLHAARGTLETALLRP